MDSLDVAFSLQLTAANDQDVLITSQSLAAFQTVLRCTHLQEFWGTIAHVPDNSGFVKALRAFHSSADRQATRLDALGEILGVSPLDPATHSQTAVQFHAMLSSLMVSSAPTQFTVSLRKYFETRLQQFSAAAYGGWVRDVDSDRSSEEDLEFYKEIVDFNAMKVLPQEWIDEVCNVSRWLQDLGLGAMCEEAYTVVLREKLQSRIQRTGASTFDKPMLAPMLSWLNAVPLPFLQLLLPRALGEGMYLQWCSRLRWLVYETLGALRTTELFDMICDYPESIPAISDLQECLRNTNQYGVVVSTLLNSIQKRLLQSGAATSLILGQFVSTIRVLRELDPAGVLLAAVRTPLQHYLRCRKDTIRCIVTMLTDEGTGLGALDGVSGESLLEELGRSACKRDDDEHDSPLSPERPGGFAVIPCRTVSHMEGWMPEAVDAEPRRTARIRSVTDILSMLIAVYGSKELLVNEYRALLAERLLAKDDYHIERETRTLELLKLRFGETNMHDCEVMLKDMGDSKRTNSNIKTPALHAETPATQQDIEHAVGPYSILVLWSKLGFVLYSHQYRLVFGSG
mmetsp:Transcript_48544/g.92867  ORF Transcript_48544/g.92867 Transcript_48544/m.92867 type:complete len:570 (+) Transcript_48544:271-1980(+)